MDLLDSEVHRDAWGSITAIPQLLGEEPDGTPRSELWMGAHPSSPSRVERAGAVRSLADVITADPVAELGASVVDANGPRLPFLLKVLAAAAPLSLQAHPSLAQAAAGFADEERRAIALDAPDRNYADANHKPEMLCALTEFHALCGFRPVGKTVALLESLGVDGLAVDLEALRATPDASGLRTVLTRLLHLPTQERGALVAAVAASCSDLAAAGGTDSALAQTVVDLAARYPADIGVVCAVLMHRVTLQPGEAVFLGAGNLHAYLLGVGVEIMASSDNVMRGGLTVRHVDVDELLAILDTTPGPVPLVRPAARDDVTVVYAAPVPDFELSRLTLRAGQPYDLPPGRPSILLVVEGGLAAKQPGRTLEVGRGRACFIPASDPPTVLAGDATAYLASTATPGGTAAGGAAG